MRKFETALDPTMIGANAGAPAPAPVQDAEPAPAEPADFVAKVVNVRLFTDEENGNTVYLRLNKKFATMKRGEDLVFRESQTQELAIFPNQLLDILREDDETSFYLASLDNVFGDDFDKLKMILSSAVVVIEFKKHLKGSVVDNVTLDRDKIFSVIKSISLSKLGKMPIKKFIKQFE